MLGKEFNDPELETIYDFFNTSTLNPFKGSLRDCVHLSRYPNLSVIPASKALMDIQSRLESKYKVFKLKKALDELIESRGFEEVFIDTPPALNFYSTSALIASHSILIPFDCDAFSSDAIDYVIQIINEIKEDHNPQLEMEGIIINQFQKNTNMSIEMVEGLKRKKYKILTPYLKHSTIMKEKSLKAKTTRSFIG